LVVTVFALTTFALGGAALAHARYASSTPAPGQTLASSPAMVVVNFDEELASGSTGSVADANGAAASTGGTIDPNERTKLTIALKPSLPNGVYKVSWHSVSADDGDELDGTFFFGVGVPAPSTATAPNPVGIALVAAGLLVALISLARAPRRKLAR
jgi:methionine-rich copper-binding protein CopC